MAITHSCDLGVDGFVDRSGADRTTNVLTGPAGLQAAIRGTGLAAALVAGNMIEVKGTGDESRLVLIDCDGTSVTGWGIGDVVHNKDAGSTWQGVVVETNSGAFLGADDLALVWLDSGYDEDDILVAEGVTNDNAGGGAGDPTDVDPIAARSTPGIIYDNNQGSTALPLSTIAVNASWAEDGTHAILDGKDKATYNVTVDNLDHLHFRNIHALDSFSHGWFAPVAAYYCHWGNCISELAGGDGWGGNSEWRYSNWLRCKAYEFSGNYGFFGTDPSFSHCTAYNGATGFFIIRGVADGCVAFQCSSRGYLTNLSVTISNCVADENVNGIWLQTPDALIIACRITNNTGFGVVGSQFWVDPYTFYGGNNANWQNDYGIDLVNGESTRTISDVSADIGYIDPDNATLADRNYGLTNQAAARRQEVTL